MNRFSFHYDPRTCGYRFAFRFPLLLNRYKRSKQVQPATRIEPLAVVAVIYSGFNGVMKMKLKDGSISGEFRTKDFDNLIGAIDDQTWLALRRAMLNADTWIPVE